MLLKNIKLHCFIINHVRKLLENQNMSNKGIPYSKFIGDTNLNQKNKKEKEKYTQTHLKET